MDLKTQFESILKEEQLNEFSVSRLYSHLDNHVPVGAITAFRAEYTLSENKSRNKILEASIRNAGFGFVKVKGNYEEESSDGSKVRVTEDSFLVIGEQGKESTLKSFLKKAGEKWEQDSVFYTDGKQGFLIGTRDTNWLKKNATVNVGAWTPKKIGSIFSSWKRKDFTFAMAEGDNWFSRLGKKRLEE